MPGGRGLGIHVSRIGCLATSGALLGALIVCAPGAERDAVAGRVAPDRSAHLLLVSAQVPAAAALAASDARVIARYGTFSLVEAAGADERELREAGADRRDDMREIALPGGSLDPLRDRPSLASRGAPERDETQALVQFAGPVKDDWLARLRATGASVVQYVAQNGYVVHARGREVDRLAALVGTDPAVRAVTAVRASDKLVGGVSRGTGPRPVAVQTLAGAEGARARRAGRIVGPPSGGRGLPTRVMSLSGPEIGALADDPGVISIAPYSEPRLLGERASQIVAGNVGATGSPLDPPGYLDWFTGVFGGGTFDFAIDVTDEGLANGSAGSPGHSDFLAEGTGASRIDYARDFTSDNDPRDCGGHGTGVASIAAGFGTTGSDRVDASGYRLGLGVAPRARIGSSKIFNCAGTFDADATFAQIAAQASADGAKVSNNSWGFPGQGSQGAYTKDSSDFDELVRDARPGVAGNQQMTYVFAAGNQGDLEQGAENEGYASVNPPGTAKNVITVGASEGINPIGRLDGCAVDDAGADQADDILNYSSRGPTDDLRLKPDVVAPGTHLIGARPQPPTSTNGSCSPFNSLYNVASGTSEAAAAVSGAAALVYRWYDEELGQPPSPAMVKALLVGSATDLAGGANGLGDTVGPAPDSDQGWGRVNVGRVLDGTPREYVDQSGLLTNPGQVVDRVYQVLDPTAPVRVTLAYTDAPGPINTTESVANDLDLAVRQGGRTYKGNVIAAGRSVTGGDADPRNNLESVILPAGAAGRLAVSVQGTGINDDGVPGAGDGTDQDYALVVSNAEEQGPSAVLTTEAVTVGDAPTEGDADGVVEPGEQFDLSVELGNAGTVAASGPTGSATGSGGLTLTGTGSWPTIPVDETSDQSSPFDGALAYEASCGTEYTGALDVGTGSPLAFTVPTGSAGPPVSRTKTAGVAIPDDSAAGVASTLFVAERGLIKDLDVRLNIAHPWVGDLRVDLVAPDGTTVRLVEHPGGPDNSGDNLSGTVLSDGAPSIADGTAPYPGTYRPLSDQLSRLEGKQQRGTWTLRVRDLYEGQAGSLVSWGTMISPAVCDFDKTPPSTTIISAPPPSNSSTAASFGFASDDAGAVFDCRLDGAAYQPCESTQGFSGLGVGSHTLDVVAVDGSGNRDPTPASHAWSVVSPPIVVPPGGGGNPLPTPDRTAPVVSLTAPTASAVVGTRRPTLSGRAGTAGGDSAGVTVRLWRGSAVSGQPDRTLSASRAPGGSWSVVPGSDLADGQWTARAQQSDAAGNTGVSAAVTFGIDTTRPDFALLPAEADRGETRRGGLALLAGCGSACTVSAELRAGKGRRGDPALAKLEGRLSAAGTRWLALKPTRSGRALLRRARRGTLHVKITTAAGTLSVRRALVLTRVDLAREARRGLRYAGVCGERCSISSRLTMAPREARRLGIRVRGRAHVTVASARASASTDAVGVTLKPGSAARKRLLRAGRAKVTMDTTVNAEQGPSQSSSRRLTLRR